MPTHLRAAASSMPRFVWVFIYLLIKKKLCWVFFVGSSFPSLSKIGGFFVAVARHKPLCISARSVQRWRCNVPVAGWLWPLFGMRRAHNRVPPQGGDARSVNHHAVHFANL
jgi:hypothetical protein